MTVGSLLAMVRFGCDALTLIGNTPVCSCIIYPAPQKFFPEPAGFSSDLQLVYPEPAGSLSPSPSLLDVTPSLPLCRPPETTAFVTSWMPGETPTFSYHPISPAAVTAVNGHYQPRHKSTKRLESLIPGAPHAWQSSEAQNFILHL